MAGGRAMPPVEEIAAIVVCDGDQPTLDLLCEQLVEGRFKVLPAPSGTDAAPIRVGVLVVDPGRRKVTVGDREGEGRLLARLLKAGRV